MPSLGPLLLWLVSVALILIALAQALRHPWDREAGVPRWMRLAVPLLIAALGVAVITWVVLVRR